MFIGAAIILFAVVSAYLALVIVTRVDSLFSPTKQITLPDRVGRVLPGVDTRGESGTQDPINILVLGLDRRPDEGDIASRTDSMFILRVDPKLQAVGIVGIPRDMWVEIPGRSGGTFMERINAVYVAGELNGYDQGGMELLKEVIEDDDNLGIKIDKYVLVDFQGFETIIDELGGIEVDVPEPVFDPYYSRTELPGDYDPQNFEPGLQHMDGATALAYSRIRFSGDDLDRIQRQQRVIFAVIEKAQSVNVLKNAIPLWEKYKNTIQTDISDLQIPGYAALAADVKNNIYAVSLGPAVVPYTTADGAQVLVGNKEKIKEIIDSLFARSGDAPDASEGEPTPVRVQVQNGTGTEGLAARVVGFIASKGYPPNDLNAANVFDGASHETSEIIDMTGVSRQSAYLIAKWLDLPPESVRDATAAEKAAMEENGAEIVVILGDDVDFDRLIQSPTTLTPDS